MELRREIKFYLSFTDEEVFRGVDLPEKEESCPMVPATADITTAANIPGATNVPEVQPYQSQCWRRKLQSMLGGKKYYTHPGQC